MVWLERLPLPLGATLKGIITEATGTPRRRDLRRSIGRTRGPVGRIEWTAREALLGSSLCSPGGVLDGGREGVESVQDPTMSGIEGTHVLIAHYMDNVAAEALAIEGADCVFGIFLGEVFQEPEHRDGPSITRRPISPQCNVRTHSQDYSDPSRKRRPSNR